MHPKLTSDDKLSPQKIAVLILIYLYLNDELPIKRRVFYFLSKQLEGIPIVQNHSLVLLTTLQEFLNAIESCGSSTFLTDYGSRAVREFQFKFLYVAWNIKSADLIQQLSMDAFKRTAEPLCITALNEIQVSSRSPFGRFVRMMAASLKLLRFEDSLELMNDFCRFRASTDKLFNEISGLGFHKPKFLLSYLAPSSDPLYPTWNALLRMDNRNKKFGKEQEEDEKDRDDKFFGALHASLDSGSATTPELGSEIKSKDGTVDSTQALLLAAVTDIELLINEQVRLLECFGTPTPEFLKTIIRHMASPQASSMCNSMPSMHYLQYLENLGRGDYHESFNSLHKYFDYMVSQGSKYFYHFALVSKASLHQYFGEDEEALDSMEEAISIARENKDNATLTYVLSWLYDFMRRKPALWSSRIFRQVKNELRLLDYLVKKSLSVSLSLAAMSYRFETEHLLNGRCQISKYYESLFKAGFFAVNESTSSFIGVCHTSFAIWQNLGYPHLSELFAGLGLHYSKVHGSVRDLVIFNMGIARCEYYLGRSELMLPDMKENLELCNSNAAQFRLLRISLLLRQIEVALSKGRIHMAQELLLYLPANLDLDLDCLFEKVRVSILLQIAQGNISEALIYVSASIGDIDKLRSSLRPDIVRLLDLNLLKASVLIHAGAPLRALSVVIQQLETAKQLGLRLLAARSCLHLIQILNNTGQHKDAFYLAKSVLPLIISVGNIEITSMVFFELATSHYLFLDNNIVIDTSKTTLFAHFLNFLSLSIAGYKKCVNLSMLMLSFELENKMATTALKHEDIRILKPFKDFCRHSQMGLDILRRRAHDESDYGFLRSP